MKYFKRANIYKASNVTFSAAKREAHSYGWWKFVTIVNGKVIFNDYNYSPSTCKHQSKVRSLMGDLGVKIDLYVSVSRSLDDSPTNLGNIVVENMYTSLYETEIKLFRTRKGHDWLCDQIAEIKNNIVKAEKIFKVHLSLKYQKQIKSNVFREDTRKLQLARERRAELKRQANMIASSNAQQSPYLTLVGDS